MFVKYNDTVVNLNGCTAIANKGGKLSVYYGDKSELIGEFTKDTGAMYLNKIYNALASGEATISLD